MGKKFLYGIFIFIAITCSVLMFGSNKITGDGVEYLTMSISFKNHLTPERTQQDVEELKDLLSRKYNCLIKTIQKGYYTALPARGGGDFSYHFWSYSLICTPVLTLLTVFNQNPVGAFKITNLLLILTMFGWILFRNNAMDYKNKIFLALFLYFSPLWFYYKWTHTEVFTFTLLMIGLTDYYNKRKNSALFFTACASLQNPAAAVVPFFMMIRELCILFKNFSKQTLIKFIISTLISCIVFIPYIFYYYFFEKFSLIGEYATDLNSICIAKILSLFFDLNFGLIIYCPILLGMTVYGVIKKDKLSIISLITVVLFAIIDSAQINWNPGIHLLNRYSYWMIPVLLFGCFNIIQSFSDRWKKGIIITNLILILPWYAYTRTNAASLHIKFQPVATLVLNIAPALYNPQYEVFAERTLENEESFQDKLPITYFSNGQPLKTLNYDKEKKKYYYTNYSPDISKLKIKIRHKNVIFHVGFNGIKKEVKHD